VLPQGSATLVSTASPLSIVMVKDKTLQAPFPNDQGHGRRAIFKKLFRKQKTAPQSFPPITGPALPATSSTNQDKPLDAELTPALAPGKQKEPQVNITPDGTLVSKDDDPSQTSWEERTNAKFHNIREELEAEPTPGLATGKQKEPQVTTIPDDAPVPVWKDDDPSQTSREERANAEFHKIREELEKVIQNSNGASLIQLSFLDSSCSEIGNLSQMAWDIDLAILEFRKECDKQKESQKGKATAKNWVHKFSFAGQRILQTASSASSVGSSFWLR
jgi:hypothetical protein